MSRSVKHHVRVYLCWARDFLSSRSSFNLSTTASRAWLHSWSSPILWPIQSPFQGSIRSYYQLFSFSRRPISSPNTYLKRFDFCKLPCCPRRLYNENSICNATLVFFYLSVLNMLNVSFYNENFLSNDGSIKEMREKEGMKSQRFCTI